MICNDVKSVNDMFVKRYGIKPKLIEPFSNKATLSINQSGSQVNSAIWLYDKPEFDDSLSDVPLLLDNPLFFGKLIVNITNTVSPAMVDKNFIQVRDYYLNKFDLGISEYVLTEEAIIYRSQGANYGIGPPMPAPGYSEYFDQGNAGFNVRSPGLYVRYGTDGTGTLRFNITVSFCGHRLYFR